MKNKRYMLSDPQQKSYRTEETFNTNVRHWLTLTPQISEQYQACNPPDPHWFFFSFSRWSSFSYGTRYQSGSFSLNNVGSGIHCLRSFSFLFCSIEKKRKEISQPLLAWISKGFECSASQPPDPHSKNFPLLLSSLTVSLQPLGGV